MVPELGVVYDWFARREPQRAAAELRLLFVWAPLQRSQAHWRDDTKRSPEPDQPGFRV